MPGRDNIGFEGVESVTYKVFGLLHVSDSSVVLEWTGTRTTDQVSFAKVGTDVDRLPLDWVEIPIDELLGARVIGGWWRPRLELRARNLETFHDVPTSRGALVRLRIARRDRGMARDVAAEIEGMIGDALLAFEDRSLLDTGNAGS